jgi:hypothetical protein
MADAGPPHRCERSAPKLRHKMPTKLQIHLAKVHRLNKGRTQANFSSRALLLTAGLAPDTITSAQRLFGQMSTGRLPEELALATPEEREAVSQGDGGGSALDRQRSVPMLHQPVLVTRTPLQRPRGLAFSPADAPPSLPTLATGWAAPPFAAACPSAAFRHYVDFSTRPLLSRNAPVLWHDL